MGFSRSRCIGIGLGFLLASSASAAPVVIDDFSNDQSQSVSGGNGPIFYLGGVAASNAIGGARFMRLDRLTGSHTNSLSVNSGGSGFLDLQATFEDTASALVYYDKGTDNVLTPNGLGGIDLSAGGSNGMIEILGRSTKPAPLTITVYSDAGNYSHAQVNLPGGGLAAFTPLDIPFGSFVVDAGAGADFSSVGAISFQIDGSNAPSLEAQLDSIVVTSTTTVPEPGTLLLLTAGFAGLGFGRHKRTR
jgi:hypothetical protein